MFFTKNNHLMEFLILLLICFSLIISLSYGSDTISANNSLTGDQTIISKDENFELGFFKPGNSSKYYIGIWYKKVSLITVVWVANRETPVSDRFNSELKIIDGNLVLLNESKLPIWSTNVTTTNLNSTIAVIHDDGNLVLTDGSNSVEPVWQSFDYPTHTWLPGGKVGYNRRTDRKQALTSWRSQEDPAEGLFSLEIDQNEKQYVLKWNNSVQYWASGSWNGQMFRLVPEMRLNYIYNFSYHTNENESYFTYSLYDPSILLRFIMDFSGQLRQLSLIESRNEWNLFWSQPRALCGVYAMCGSFATCRESEMPFCNCLDGFKPRSENNWNLGSFSDGCVRKTELGCTVKQQKTKFNVYYVPVKFLTFLENTTPISSDESACRESCLDDCDCDAYSFIINSCRIWNGKDSNNMSLVFLSDDSNSATFPFNIKVSSSDLPNSTSAENNTKVLVAGVVSGFFGLVFLCSIGVIFYRREKRRGRKERNQEYQELQLRDGSANVRFLVDPAGILSAEDKKGIDVPFFDFKSILSATDYFSLGNKLGQGGFGPVYKGMLPGGVEIAVKRLSNQSGQG